MPTNRDIEELDNPWKPGLPKKYDPEKYEIYLSPIGAKWHRKKPKDLRSRDSGGSNG